MAHSASLNFVLLLNRLSLGYVFVFAGCSKIFGKGGVSAFVHGDYADYTPHWVPHWFSAPYGYALPFGELFFGAMMIFGLLGRWPAGIVMLMLTSILIASTHVELLKKGRVDFTLVYLTLAMLMVVTGPGRLGLDGLIKHFRSGGKAKAKA